MSFVGYKSLIEEGDTVVVYLSAMNMQTVVVQKDHVYQSKYGAFKWIDVIGKRYGSLIKCTKGWVYVLHPTPELWTINLPHRTQIIYSTDISCITLQLDLKPGSIVAEAGTGSGSLSHAIIRSVAPNGHLYTFDFHEERARRCEEEFKNHGLQNFVTVTHRDVVANGFDLEQKVDAVFLDLPLPWEVIPAAKKAFKSEGGRLCSFSPCIEQVQKTCLALRGNGFSDIETLECLQRPLDVRKVSMAVWTPKTNTVSIGNVSKRAKLDDDKIKVEEEKVETSLEWMESLGPQKQVTHTGFLTFATLYPTNIIK